MAKAVKATNIALNEVAHDDMPDISVNDAATSAKMESFISSAFDAYQSGKQRIHLATVAAVMWAAKHGDAHHLNKLYDKFGGFGTIKSADATNLRTWCGRVTELITSAGVKATWLGFNVKASEKRPAGFFVKAGPEFLAARQGMDTFELKTGPRFMDRVATSKGNSLSIQKILEELVKLSSSVGKKEEKAFEESETSVPLPESLRKLIADVSSTAEMELAVLKAATPAGHA